MRLRVMAVMIALMLPALTATPVSAGTEYVGDLVPGFRAVFEIEAEGKHSLVTWDFADAYVKLQGRKYGFDAEGGLAGITVYFVVGDRRVEAGSIGVGREARFRAEVRVEMLCDGTVRVATPYGSDSFKAEPPVPIYVYSEPEGTPILGATSRVTLVDGYFFEDCSYSGPGSPPETRPGYLDRLLEDPVRFAMIAGLGLVAAGFALVALRGWR